METIWIQGEDIHILDDIVAELGWTPLNKGSVARVAMDSNGIAGFHVLQLRPHAEPLYVRDDLRGTPLAANLAADMEQFLSETGTVGFIVIADDPAAAKLCEKYGMKKVLAPVYIR